MTTASIPEVRRSPGRWLVVCGVGGLHDGAEPIY